MEGTSCKLKSRKNEARSLLKKCFKNNVFYFVPFEIWLDIVRFADIETICLLAQTCWGFREAVENLRCMDLALRYRKEGEIANALSCLVKCARYGSSLAMFHLGYALCNGSGWGVKENETEGKEWFKKSVNRGNEAALAWYARCLHSGDSAVVDLWGKKALSSNNSLAIGFCHYHGMGTPRDFEMAFKYFSVSAEEGDEFGEYMLGDSYYFGEGIEKNPEKALYWSLRSAEKGLCIAQLDVAYIYREGHGCEQSNELSIAWNKKAAKQGNEEAKNELRDFGIDLSEIEKDGKNEYN